MNLQLDAMRYALCAFPFVGLRSSAWDCGLFTRSHPNSVLSTRYSILGISPRVELEWLEEYDL